jgi:hypothetical protein
VNYIQIKLFKKEKAILAGCQWFTAAILATQEAEIRGIVVRSQPGQIAHEILSLKYPTQKRAGGVAQVGECLPSKRKALCSNPSNIKKKKFKWNCHMVLLCSITL